MEPQILSLREAAKVAGVTHMAVRYWCVHRGIGEKRDGIWHVDMHALRNVMLARSVLQKRDA